MKVGLGFVTENLGLKIVSLFLAIGFWFYVVGEESVEITKTVPLQIISPNEKLTIIKSSSNFLEVTVHAPRNLVTALTSERITASHKIESVEKPGDYSFNVDPSDFKLPVPTMRVARVFPSVVTVTLDEVIVKKLPIEVDLTGEPAYGYRIVKEMTEIDPNAVLVEGPRQVLEKMEMIHTEPIQLVGRVRSFRRTVRVKPPEGIRIVGDGITEVQATIKAESAEKEILNVPVKPLGLLPSNHFPLLVDREVTVVLKGPRAIVDGLTAKDLMAFIEIDGLKDGIHQLPVKFVLPPDIVLKDETPSVSVEVKKL